MFKKEAINYKSYQQWDFLENRLVIDLDPTICSINGLPFTLPGLTKIFLWRDETYTLKGEITGRSSLKNVRSLYSKVNSQGCKGEVLSLHTVIIVPYPGKSYTVRGFYISGSTISTNNYSIKFSAHSIESSWETIYLNKFKDVVEFKDTPHIFNEWCVNAPSNEEINLCLGRDTAREIKIICKESNEGLEKIYEDIIEKSQAIGDHFMFLYKGFKIRVRFLTSQTPDIKSNKINIEYLSKTDQIPCQETRKIVIEFLSFTFGRQLMSIGSSTYINTEFGMKQTSYTSNCPWSKALAGLAREPSYPPIDFKLGLRDASLDEKGIINDSTINIEDFTNNFILSYEKERSSSCLVDLLWGLWSAELLPSREQLLLYSAAFEVVTKKFLESRTVDPKLIDNIRNQIENFNQMSVNQRNKLFLSEIGIKLSKREKSAMNKRHSVAHGDLSVLSQRNDENRHRDILDSNCYRTLLHRIFLKILGYNGYYIDYGTLDFPSKKMEE